MKFIISKKSNTDIEVKKFFTYLDYYPEIYSATKKNKIRNNIYNKIDEVNIKRNLTMNNNITKEEKKQSNKVSYIVGNGPILDKFNAIKDIGRILLEKEEKSFDYYNNYTCPNGVLRKDALTGEIYGNYLNNGSISILSKIAILKKDYESELTNFIEKGGHDFSIGRSDCLSEDIARLLFIVSTPNNKGNKSKYITKYIKEEGIDYEFGSLYFNSFLNGNFDFERDFDKKLGIGSYLNLFKNIDRLEEEKDNHEILESIILKINSYNNNKLNDDMMNGIIDDEDYNMHQLDFSNKVQKILNCYLTKREK